MINCKIKPNKGSVNVLGVALFALALNACQSKRQDPPPPNPPNQPGVPNCAADGPGCKQFNPDKPRYKK